MSKGSRRPRSARRDHLAPAPIMCPFCTATLLGVAAGTVTTGGVATLFAFTRRLARHAESRTPVEPEDPRS